MASCPIPKAKPVHRARTLWLTGRSEPSEEDSRNAAAGVYSKPSPKPSLEAPDTIYNDCACKGKHTDLLDLARYWLLTDTGLWTSNRATTVYWRGIYGNQGTHGVLQGSPHNGSSKTRDLPLVISNGLRMCNGNIRNWQNPLLLWPMEFWLYG